MLLTIEHFQFFVKDLFARDSRWWNSIRAEGGHKCYRPLSLYRDWLKDVLRRSVASAANVVFYVVYKERLPDLTVNPRTSKHSTCAASHRQTMQNSKGVIVRYHKVMHTRLSKFDPQ